MGPVSRPPQWQKGLALAGVRRRCAPGRASRGGAWRGRVQLSGARLAARWPQITKACACAPRADCRNGVGRAPAFIRVRLDCRRRATGRRAAGLRSRPQLAKECVTAARAGCVRALLQPARHTGVPATVRRTRWCQGGSARRLATAASTSPSNTLAAAQIEARSAASKRASSRVAYQLNCNK